MNRSILITIEERDLNNSIWEKDWSEKKQSKNFNIDDEDSEKSQEKNFKNLSERKRKIRKNQGLTPKTLAEKAGVGEEFILEILDGDYDFGILKDFEEALETPLILIAPVPSTISNFYKK